MVEIDLSSHVETIFEETIRSLEDTENADHGRHWRQGAKIDFDCDSIRHKRNYAGTAGELAVAVYLDALEDWLEERGRCHRIRSSGDGSPSCSSICDIPSMMVDVKVTMDKGGPMKIDKRDLRDDSRTFWLSEVTSRDRAKIVGWIDSKTANDWKFDAKQQSVFHQSYFREPNQWTLY